MNQRFRQYLAAKGLSQRRFATIADVSPSTVSRFCAGEPILTDSFVKILESCGDLSLDWLVFGRGQMLLCPSLDGSPQSTALLSLLDSQSRLLIEKDRIILEKDALIGRLQEKVMGK